MTSPMTDIEELKELAGKVLDRVWYVLGPPWVGYTDTFTILSGSPDPHAGRAILETLPDEGLSEDEDHSRQELLAEWLESAANPQSVLSLISRLEAAEARVEVLEDCYTKFFRPEVLAFARLMEKALRRKDAAYGGNSWKKNDQPDELIPHIMDRAERAHDQVMIAKGHYPEDDYDFTADMALAECAEQAVHAANYAMMTADVCGALDADYRDRKALEQDNGR